MDKNHAPAYAAASAVGGVAAAEKYIRSQEDRMCLTEISDSVGDVVAVDRGLRLNTLAQDDRVVQSGVVEC